MNYAHFAGRIGRDAEVRSTQSGDKVTGFSLAVDTGFGERKATLWIDCSLWGERGEKLSQHLVKGKQLTVSGDVGLREYTKNDGTHGAAITCNVQRLTLQGGGEPRASASPAPAAARPTSDAVPFNDDIPF